VAESLSNHYINTHVSNEPANFYGLKKKLKKKLKKLKIKK